MSRREVKVTTQEAKRQVMIIEELKQTIQKKKEELGRNLFYSLSTYGCQMIHNNVIFEPLTINDRGTFDSDRF